ncbi:MAG TPA: NgoPII family restriction endonuclease [Treponemataceae bacterium]|nr:NgoPII family restriction endonuclease [Spirochaetaceae bacterium]HOE07310.1 NgoPII family restriction endonuclease [Treponemataceae bacterium]HQL04329.1 NgoPII family restriction endonuclease [Treponemataceae bacterium]
MSNLINAIVNLVNSSRIDLNYQSKIINRANSMGEGLEEYIKDLFAGTIDIKDQQIRNEMLSHTFSYLGNQNNPPDIMLFGGDAIEVKKIESKSSALALNSSYPKAKLFSDNPLIKKECRECENWLVKDMLYTVGCVKDNNLTSLAFVYGDDYCAKKETYENIKKKIKEGVESIPDVEFTESRELGHVNRVDPLGITYLRVRGMWGIENPFSVFKYIYERKENVLFNFMCIINQTKFDSFENSNELFELENKNKDFKVNNVKIKNPNNPAQLRNAKLITFFIEAE